MLKIVPKDSARIKKNATLQPQKLPSIFSLSSRKRRKIAYKLPNIIKIVEITTNVIFGVFEVSADKVIGIDHRKKNADAKPMSSGMTRQMPNQMLLNISFILYM